MPKKTKKEKLRADTHRQPMRSHRDPVFAPSHAVSPSTAPSITPMYTIHQVTLRQTPAAKALHVEQKAIKLDIIKTICWSALIIMGELLLSRYLK